MFVPPEKSSRYLGHIQWDILLYLLSILRHLPSKVNAGFFSLFFFGKIR